VGASTELPTGAVEATAMGLYDSNAPSPLGSGASSEFRSPSDGSASEKVGAGRQQGSAAGRGCDEGFTTVVSDGAMTESCEPFE
jgi:hypothetical protein